MGKSRNSGWLGDGCTVPCVGCLPRAGWTLRVWIILPGRERAAVSTFGHVSSWSHGVPASSDTAHSRRYIASRLVILTVVLWQKPAAFWVCAEPVPRDDVYRNVCPGNRVRVLAGHAGHPGGPAGMPEERIPSSLRAVQGSNLGAAPEEADVRLKVRLGYRFSDHQDQFVGNATKDAVLHARVCAPVSA
ncbi:hypothetical protein AcW1_004925 [Taiwanofungus camphoratus]|nr:hypothetical protein AcW1_004925 [Antrodia cinnamomea]